MQSLILAARDQAFREIRNALTRIESGDAMRITDAEISRTITLVPFAQVIDETVTVTPSETVTIKPNLDIDWNTR